MKKSWKTGITAAVLLSAMLTQGAGPAYSAEAVTSVVSSPSVNYGLTDEIRAAVKSAAVVQTDNGAIISATIRLYNGGTALNRLPEHELQVRTSDGLTYSLVASATNPASLQPKEVREFTYMGLVDSNSMFKIDQVSFVHVDLYQYPKVETNLLAIPVGSEVWYDNGDVPEQPYNPVAWNNTFSIPGVNSDIVYTPAGFSDHVTTEGPAKFVTLLAENTGEGRETVPGFRIDALSASKTYKGALTEKELPSLQPGEKAYIHYAIPVESGTQVSGLLLSTTENYASGTATNTVLSTGKLTLSAPTGGYAEPVAALPYTYGAAISLDPLSQLIDQKTQVSLLELHLSKDATAGYNTVIAKFKLTNTRDTVVALPDFQTKLTNDSGKSYAGVRQSKVVDTMNPGLSYVVSYAFQIPESEDSTKLSLKLLDGKKVAPYSQPIASLQTELQPFTDSNTFSLYPYQVKLNDIRVNYQYDIKSGGNNYFVRLDLDMDQTESVVVGQNFSKLRVEIEDTFGEVLGSTDTSFTGAQKLIDGERKFTISRTGDYTYPIILKIYEVIETPNGEAKRLLKTYKPK